jgi:hypothetical protein
MESRRGDLIFSGALLQVWQPEPPSLFLLPLA